VFIIWWLIIFIVNTIAMLILKKISSDNLTYLVVGEMIGMTMLPLLILVKVMIKFLGV
jgi:hypothetical protein